MPVRRKEANYPDPLNGVRVMIEFQRPSHDVRDAAKKIEAEYSIFTFRNVRLSSQTDERFWS